MVQSPPKSERMELRRAIGNRELPNIDEQQKAAERRNLAGQQYLIAYACFACRKSWKVKPRDEREAKCPECGGVTHEMGRAFKAPKKTDSEQWEKVEVLWEAGFRFWPTGSTEIEPLPERLRDVQDFIKRNPCHPARWVR